MKSSPRLLKLRSLNDKLRKNSWFIYQDFLDKLLRSIQHPHAEELLLLKERGDFLGMIELADRISSTEYRTAAEHRLCNQLSAVIRKYPFPSGSVALNPRAKALETFMKSERKCKLVNKRFKLFLNLRSPHELPLSAARSWISHALGELNLQDVWEHCSFGPGASIGVHGNATNEARKLLAERWSVSPSAFYYCFAALSRDMHIWELLLKRPESPFFSIDICELLSAVKSRAELVGYNKITFVPKTAKTERTIAVEPLLNGFVQKGVDVLMRKRLKRVGIDLDDQSHNQGLAYMGSLRDDPDPYVTIDLSSASDSISTELCRYMLPPDWFDFLDSIRSKSFTLNGEISPYEKFTTMGNGFCFPLETLLFASLCNVVYSENHRKPDFSVYGDDIIVRSSVAPRLLALLRICGFKANMEKTFLTGPFRESCGADWFEGEDVRPATLDYAFDSLENIFKFCNIIRSKDSIAGIFYESLQFLESLVPQDLLFVRPYKGNVDSALEVPFDIFLASKFSRYNKHLQCWSWVELVVRPVRDKHVQGFAGYNVVLARGALKGVKSDTPFTERRRTRTKIRRVSYCGGWSLYEPGLLFSRYDRLCPLL